MPRVFLSWYDGHQHPLAARLLQRLKESGFDVEHSPESPDHGPQDERWRRWYSDGLPNVLRRAHAFVAVITPNCDGSTWMLQEYQEAYRAFLQRGRPALFFVRFDDEEHPVKYPDYYLQTSIRLSPDPDAAAQELVANNRA